MKEGKIDVQYHLRRVDSRRYQMTVELPNVTRAQRRTFLVTFPFTPTGWMEWFVININHGGLGWLLAHIVIQEVAYGTTSKVAFSSPEEHMEAAKEFFIVIPRAIRDVGTAQLRTSGADLQVTTYPRLSSYAIAALCLH